MAKFKVGDKVRILDVDKIAEGVNNGYSTGEITLVVRVNSDGEPYILNKRNPEGHPLVIVSDELRYIKKVCEPSENQRITALEKEIAELRLFKELAQEMEDNSFHDLERIEEIEGRLEHLEQAVQQYFAVPGESSKVNEVSNIYHHLVVKNVKQLPEAEKLAQEKGLTCEDMELIFSTFKLRDEESTQVTGTTSEEREKSIYNFEPDSSWLNELSIDNGVVIDGVRVKGLRSVEITSGLSNISTVKVEFLTKINGLDNIRSMFSQIERNKH